LPKGLKWRLLDEAGLRAIAVRGSNGTQMLSAQPMPQDVRLLDMRNPSWMGLMRDAITDMFWPDPRPLQVIGHAMTTAERVEIVVLPAPLRRAMLEFSSNILLFSLLISVITAAFVFFTLNQMIVRPVRRLAENVTSFQQDPEDADRVIQPSPREDEIGQLEHVLQRMQLALGEELRQKKRLAALGLAVSKINHDLRNMLASARLISDRISELSDPTVQRFAPKLIATLGRASQFCEATLAYGRASEPAPRRSLITLAPVVEDAAELAGIGQGSDIGFALTCDPGLKIDADQDQLSRVLLNLFRNSLQALQSGRDGVPCLRVDAKRAASTVVIYVSDNGPGVPDRLKPVLFQAFVHSSRPGGSGLGLAIAAELVSMHGGSITLVERGPGACFRIQLPDRAKP
jgi:signal transduction histidine kinase